MMIAQKTEILYYIIFLKRIIIFNIIIIQFSHLAKAIMSGRLQTY